jgi:hypothetical protein
MRAARRDARWALFVASVMVGACGTDVVELQSSSGQAPKPPCVSIPQSGGSLCIYCGANYSQQRACLKCDSVSATTACSTCFWSDSVDGGTCQQCVTASGSISTIGCNELRSDLLPPTASP